MKVIFNVVKPIDYESTARSSNALVTSDAIKRLGEEIETADAVLIGAGAGMSTSAGLTYYWNW